MADPFATAQFRAKGPRHTSLGQRPRTAFHLRVRANGSDHFWMGRWSGPSALESLGYIKSRGVAPGWYGAAQLALRILYGGENQRLHSDS